MKSLTRRELLAGAFSKDALKNVFGAFSEFKKAQENAEKDESWEVTALKLGKKSQERSKKFFQNIRKEG